MVSGVIRNRPDARLADAKRAIRAGDWAAGLSLLEEMTRNDIPLDAAARLLREIARIRSEGGDGDTAGLDAGLVRDADGRADLRRLLIGPLVKEGNLNTAAWALDILIEAWPDSPDDLRSSASVLARLKRWEGAIARIDAAARLDPDNPSIQTARIQLRLLAGDSASAAEIARASMAVAERVPEHSHVWMTALLRDGDAAAAARIAMKAGPIDERVAAAGVQALLACGRTAAAIAFGRGALEAGHDSAALRSQLAQAHLARSTYDDRTVAALEHLCAGVGLEPDNLRLNSLYGETLLRAGRYEQSLPFLEKSCALAPGLGHTRAIYARALRYAGRYDEAANEWLKLATRAPEQPRWQRAATAALTQAGRVDEAAGFFDAFVRRRAAALPATFASGFARLKDRAQTVAIPRARLDWAWSLRTDRLDVDRSAWERAAQWGHLADHFLLEWLECRDDRAEEAMELLADLDDAADFLASLREAGRGFIVATAHVGPMYAGLMALELLGVPSRWLASTPRVARSHYASSLISTGDQTEMQVVKASLKALQDGYAVGIAVEGALNPAAARIPFEGQEITYSSFAARAAWRLGVPSLFYAPRWQDGRIAHTLEMLPTPLPGETVDDYASRWQSAWLAQLRVHLGGPPENLRMSGGLWRHIRPVAS